MIKFEPTKEVINKIRYNMKQKVALVLSGGGARGIAHIGVIEELERRGYDICSVAGTSMGALVGGVYAGGGLSIFREWISIIDQFMLLSLMDFSFSKNGLLKGEKVLHEMQNIVPNIAIEECRIPYVAIATDLKTREEVVFDKGPLYEAIRASISLPPLFRPYELNGMTLIDGGTVNHLPLNRVKRTPGDILVAVDVSANIPVKKKYPKVKEQQLDDNELQLLGNLKRFKIHSPWKSKDEVTYVNLLVDSITIMFQHMANMSIEMYKPDIIIKMPIDSYNVLEFYEASMIIQAGIDATKEVLDNM